MVRLAASGRNWRRARWCGAGLDPEAVAEQLHLLARLDRWCQPARRAGPGHTVHDLLGAACHVDGSFGMLSGLDIRSVIRETERVPSIRHRAVVARLTTAANATGLASV